MNKVILIIFLFTYNLFANLTNIEYTKEDFKILSDLNINKSFIYDEKLNELFLSYSKKYKLNEYVRNLKRSSLYIPNIKYELNKARIPNSIIYIPMIESSFRNINSSKSGALGLWQFMPQTGKIFNLKSDEYIDERLDFVKSSKAAAKYMVSNHKKLHKWYLAILAYNCGEGRVLEGVVRATMDTYLELYPNKKTTPKIIEYQRIIENYTKNKKDFSKMNEIFNDMRTWKVQVDAKKLLSLNKENDKDYIPKSSRIYVRKIIALAMIGNREFYQNEDILKINKKPSIIAVKAKGDVHLRTIANLIDENYKELVELNKHIKKQILPKKTKNFVIYIPENKLEIYNKKKNNMKSSSSTVYIVQKGDTLASIAKKFKIQSEIIKNYNELKYNRVSPKQELIIPKNNDSKKNNKYK